MEGEFLSMKISNKIVCFGVLAYFAMLVFIGFFIGTRASSNIQFQLVIICYFSTFFVICMATYCRVQKQLNKFSIIPNTPQNELEMLSSNNNIQEIDFINKNKPDIMKCSIDMNELSNKVLIWKIIVALCLLVYTLNTHSFLYIILIYSETNIGYHIIFMVNIAFPITICLLLLSIIAINILYNLWVDTEFTHAFFRKEEFKKIILNIYVIMGWTFILFGFISCVLSSFCGMISGDLASEIVFIIFLSIVLIPLVVSLLKKFILKIYNKSFGMKNN